MKLKKDVIDNITAGFDLIWSEDADSSIWPMLDVLTVACSRTTVKKYLKYWEKNVVQMVGEAGMASRLRGGDDSGYVKDLLKAEKHFKKAIKLL